MFYKSTKTTQWRKKCLFNDGNKTIRHPYVKKKKTFKSVFHTSH